MITLDYILDPAPNDAEANLAEVDELRLRYDCFPGDVVFVVGAVDLSARWGWVPILDFAVGIKQIADGLGGEDRFEFTESDATIASMSARWRITWKSSSIPLPPSRSRAVMMTCRALLVLCILASAAIVSLSRPSSMRRPSRRQ